MVSERGRMKGGDDLFDSAKKPPLSCNPGKTTKQRQELKSVAYDGLTPMQVFFYRPETRFSVEQGRKPFCGGFWYRR